MNPQMYSGFLSELRVRRPLVHSITNYVVMNLTANALLATGASPVMAHAREEAADMAGLADALVLNIGTLEPDWVEAMLLAGSEAARRGIPIVLDPVGAGATPYRTAAAQRILETTPLTLLKGNASEIAALAGWGGRTRGVDASGDRIEAAEAARGLARRFGICVAVTGAEDIVTDGTRSVMVANGHPLLGRITGSGCTAAALSGAFCAVADGRFLEASAAALAFLGCAGEIAAGEARGPGSFAPALMDALSALTPEEFAGMLRIQES